MIADETNPPTKPNTAVLVNPDTEIFVAPRPRHKLKTANPKTPASTQPQNSANKSSNKSHDKKPLASIKQATDVARPQSMPSRPVPREQHPWLEKSAKSSPSVVQELPSVQLRTIPAAVFCQWTDCLQSLEAEIASNRDGSSGLTDGDERRWIIWANRKTLRNFARRLKTTCKDDRILVEAIPKAQVSAESGQNTESAEDGSAESRPMRKNRKAVLRALDGMPIDQVFLWPIWGDEGDVDAAWRTNDWDKIRCVTPPGNIPVTVTDSRNRSGLFLT